MYLDVVDESQVLSKCLPDVGLLGATETQTKNSKFVKDSIILLKPAIETEHFTAPVFWLCRRRVSDSVQMLCCLFAVQVWVSLWLSAVVSSTDSTLDCVDQSHQMP